MISYYALSVLQGLLILFPRGDALRTCPWLSYSAPLALSVIIGLIIAAQNFSDPNVLVMLTLANMLGIVMLLLIAKALSRDNKVRTETV